MKFESLPNELLLHTFQFLNGIHLLHTFHNLNYRLNQLLFSYFRTYYLDLRSQSKHNIHILCQKYLPLIIDHITSLHLSNDDETPNLVELFLSHDFKLNRLQSLSLYHIHSFDILNQIILQCPDLLHLKIIKCHRTSKDKNHALINNIWNLRKLIYCHLCYIVSHRIPSTGILMSRAISPSITDLSIENIHSTLKDLYDLFHHTPNLRRLSISIICPPEKEQLQRTILSLISLNISFIGSIHSMINLFQNMPNLCYLTFDTSSIYFNGHRWKEFIINYLPKIKIFRLRMNFKFVRNDNTEKQAKELVETFRTPFWLEEHQWFVRCDWISSDNKGTLYTLPYAFEKFDYHSERYFISTCPNGKDYWSYNHVRILQHNYPNNSMFKDLIPSLARFPNVDHLQMKFPFDNHFFSIIPSLTSLDITTEDEDFIHSQLPLLLNRLTHLYSLDINIRSSFLKILFQIKNTSLRRLYFKGGYLSDMEFFTKTQCDAFVKSTLARQCEVLFIGIENRTDIHYLIQSMPNLRSLIIRCNDDEWKDMDLCLINDEFTEWLQKYLPSTYSISRDNEETSNIRIWIDK